MVTQSSTGAIGRGIRTSVSVLDQLAPGGSLEWTVSGAGLGGIIDLHMLDTLGDGQRMDTIFRPQALIRRGSLTLFSGELLGWSGVRSAATATTAINFDLGPTLRAAGLPGGLTDDSTITVTFHSRILPLYAAVPAPPLGRVLGQGDPLRNTAVFSGTLAGALASSDPTTAEPMLPTSLLKTSIFAVNGIPVVGAAHAAFGDVVTYRLQLELPLTAAHHVQLLAAAPGLAGAFVFDPRATGPAPPSGHAQFGPDGSYTATAPLVAATVDAGGKVLLQLDFGDIQPVYGSGSGTIDLLVSAPFVPGAALAFTATENEANSFGLQTVANAPQAGLTLDEPSLRIQTATVYASNDNATWTGTGGPAGYDPFTGQLGDIVSSAGLRGEPFADRLSGVDAGDEITFVIAVENLVPGAKAYDLMVRATMPDGFVLPDDGAGISVTDGNGTSLAYSGDLFDGQAGLKLGAGFSLAGYDADSALNILLIIYTLRSGNRLDLSLPVHVSTAQVVAYSTQPGWANRAPLASVADDRASTEVATILPSVKIALVATSDPGTAGTLLTLGETATFDLAVTLPEGLSRTLDIAPTLPPGFTAVSARVTSIGANVTPQIQLADGTGGISFGDTLNAADGQDTVADQIHIEVTARPTRTPDGPAPHSAVVQAAVSIGPPGAATKTVDAIAVIVANPVPPVVTLALAGPSPGALLNGQAATFRITVALPVGVSTGLRILDILPAGFAYVPGSARVVQSNGITLSTPSASVTGSLLTLGFGAVDTTLAGQQVVIELQARLTGATVGAVLVNSVTAATGYGSSAPATFAAPVVNTAPALTGLPAALAARDDTALAAFAGLVLADPDIGQLQTLTVKVSKPANGVLANPGTGAYDPATGIYTVTGTLAAIVATAAALRFVPTLHQCRLGQSVQTDLSVQVQDSLGAISPATVIRVTTAATNAMPVVHDAAPGQSITPGTPVRLFTGLMLGDADLSQMETLTIQFSDLTAGTLAGTGPGHVDLATGAFTSTGTLAALMAEAGRLRFTAARRSKAAETFVTITIDDGAGGVARDTSVVVVASAPATRAPVTQAVATPQLFTGSSPANLVAVDPAGANLLAGTGGRDAYIIDGNAAGSHWNTLTAFAGSDIAILWGFQPERSVLTWSDSDGPLGHTGRILRASIPSTGGINSLTFAGLVASDTDRFAISTGRMNGLDYLSIVAPP